MSNHLLGNMLVSDLLKHLAADTGPSCTCGDWCRAVAVVLQHIAGHDCRAHPELAADRLSRQIARGDAALDSARRWKQNARKSWWADCACAECAGPSPDGWCRCVWCQRLGWVGEQVLREGHAPIFLPAEDHRLNLAHMAHRKGVTAGDHAA